MHVIKARSWASILDFYADLAHEWGREIQPMVRLVEALAASPYAAGLYGAVSLDRLLLSQYPTFEPQTEVLEVWADRQHQLLRFSYQANPYEQPYWQATASADEGFAKLEHFLRMQKWFVEYH